MLIAMAISARSVFPPSHFLPLHPQLSLLHPLSTQPTLIPFSSAVTSLPSRPAWRTLAASSDGGPLERATAAVYKWKEWWDSLGQQPSHLPTTAAWWKGRARMWLDRFETGFCLCLVALLFRMGIDVLAALMLGALMKLYLNMKADYRLVETQDTIDRIAHRVRGLVMEYQQDKKRSEATEKSKEEEATEKSKEEAMAKEEATEKSKEEAMAKEEEAMEKSQD